MNVILHVYTCKQIWALLNYGNFSIVLALYMVCEVLNKIPIVYDLMAEHGKFVPLFLSQVTIHTVEPYLLAKNVSQWFELTSNHVYHSSV